MAWKLEVDISGEKPSMLFNSGGFELFVPPTPFCPPGKPPIFVMVEDLKDTFYEVDYEAADLQNRTPWSELELHTVLDPAIVFPSLQWQKFENLAEESVEIVTGYLIAIQSRESDAWAAVKLGDVHIRKYPEEVMNWRLLESVKGPELGAEVQTGLLRHVYNRRPGSVQRSIPYVTPARILDKMERPWHKDGAALNWNLDGRFVGAARIARDQRWRLYAE